MIGAMSISALRMNGKLYGFALPLSDGSLKIKDAPNGNVFNTGSWSFDPQTQSSSMVLQSGESISMSFVSPHDLHGSDADGATWTATLFQNYNP